MTLEPALKLKTALRPVIVIAEDDPDILELVNWRLQRSGYQVMAAMNGAEALDLIRRHKPQVALLDVSMPELTGLEVVRELRAAGDATPVVMLTARARPEDHAAGIDAGADLYLTKPFSPQDLVAAVQSLLERRPALAQPLRVTA